MVKIIGIGDNVVDKYIHMGTMFSATFVLGMLSSKGDLNPKNKVKIIWGILQSSIAVILLISGGLEGLQTMAIISAFPFAIILLIMCFSRI